MVEFPQFAIVIPCHTGRKFRLDMVLEMTSGTPCYLLGGERFDVFEHPEPNEFPQPFDSITGIHFGD